MPFALYPPRPIRRSSVFLLLFGLLSLSRVPVGAAPPVSIIFGLRDGAKVSDVTTIVAMIRGDDEVQKVDFFVDGTLKVSDQSTPYAFDLDTLDLTEGPHMLTATVTDSKGKTVTAKISVIVDNELSKGADFHATRALELITEGNVDQAYRSARRALKVSPNNLRAARAVSRIHRQRREVPQSIEVLEKASIPETDVEARADLVSLYVTAAGLSESSEEFTRWSRKAMDSFVLLSAARQAALPPTGTAEEVAIRRGDLFMAARDWQKAVNEYQKCAQGEKAPVECSNRLIMAFLNASRMNEARYQLNFLKRNRKADEVTRAIEGMLMLRDHEFAKARGAVQEAVDNNVLPALIVAAYAEMGLGKMAQARELATRAYVIAPNLPDVLLLRAYLVPDPIDADKSVLRAMEIDPTLPESYALREFQTLMGRGNARKFQAADAYFDLALKRDPTNTYVLMGAFLSMIAQRRPQEAETLMNQLSALDKTSPDVFIARALHWSMADKPAKMQPELVAARKADPERWGDSLVPEAPELIARVYRYRFPTVLSPGALYPAAGRPAG